MPAIPLGIGAYRRDAGFQPPVELYNLLLEKDDSGASTDKFFRLQRPATAPFVTIAGPTTGLFRQDGVLGGKAFAGGADRLFDITGGATTNLGSIAGAGNAIFAPSVGRIGIVRNPNAFTYDGTTLAALAIPTGLAAIDVDQLNSYLIFMTPTGRFYWLVPGEATIDALDFANAESSPDGGVAVRRLVDELFMFQRESVEVWQTTGDQDAPFQRAAGRVYDKGCLHRDTVQRFDNALVWVGNDHIVYRTGQVPQDIGSPFISERIRKRTGDPSACVFGVDDHKIYVLRIPGQGSFAYDASTQAWSEFGSYEATEWLVHVTCDLTDGTLAGDATTGKIWRLDPERSNDDGAPLIRRVTGSIAIPTKPVPSSNFSLGIGSSADLTVKVRWKDGRDDWPEWYEDIEALAPYDIAKVNRAGQMREPFRSWEVLIEDDAKVRISGALFGEAWG